MINTVLAVPAPAWLVLSALFFAGGEYLSKIWASNPSITGIIWVVACYAFGTIAWLPALLHKNELAVMGTAWLLLATMATVIIGLFVFGESLNQSQWIGIGLSGVALFLLSR